MGKWSRFLFWDFERASWQYDVVVVLILAFIFATPREIFRDQPKAANVVMLPAEQGTALFWIAPQLLDGVPDAERIPKASALVKAQSKRRATVTRVEPLKDSEDAITGYMAYTTQP
jgi:hypothetical protein